MNRGHLEFEYAFHDIKLSPHLLHLRRPLHSYQALAVICVRAVCIWVHLLPGGTHRKLNKFVVSLVIHATLAINFQTGRKVLMSND